MKDRIEKLIKALSKGLFEREETVAVTLLAALSGHSVFLYGLPGTAKSLIARRIASAFKDAKHFEYLMQRFSTPEEVFGPISIQALKNDDYIRKTEGYLPTADVAFLDEIWKSSPAILNTLLTIINERVFRNGMEETKVPLKALIAASNETPPSNQGLEALYDRFVVRLLVSPMSERTNFENLLQNAQTAAHAEISKNLAFTGEEWTRHLAAIDQVKFSGEVLNIIHAIKCALKEYNENNPDKAVYVSDRRWLKIACLLKTAAHFCGRQEVIVVDTLLCRHCLWTQESNRADIAKIVEDCVQQFGSPDKTKLEEWVEQSDIFEREVRDTFFHTSDVYKTRRIKKEECIPLVVVKQDDKRCKCQINAPIRYMKNCSSFFPFDNDGNQDDRFKCAFRGYFLAVEIDTDCEKYGWTVGYREKKYKKLPDIPLPVLIKNGEAKPVTDFVKTAHKKEAESLHQRIVEVTEAAKRFYLEQQKNNYTPFVPADARGLVLTSLGKYIEDLENHCLNAERLIVLVDNHVYLEQQQSADTPVSLPDDARFINIGKAMSELLIPH